jgi:hypothetical protein
MADKKDDKSPVNGKKAAISTSSSLDEPLLDENSTEINADIDTSHLSLEETTAETASSLETDTEQQAPAIDTSHLTLEEDSSSQRSDNSASDFDIDENAAADQTTVFDESFDVPPDELNSIEEPLYINNPLAGNSPSESGIDQSQANSVSGNSVNEEELVLSTGVSDADFEQGIEGGSSTNNTNHDSENDDLETDNPIKSILETVKKPESIARDAWLNSSVRNFLLENIPSYRAKNEDQNMEAAIEKVYGGATEKRFDPKKFFKENLLFSFLLFVLVFLLGWKAAGILFPNFMPDINDQIIETVKNTASISTKDKQEEKKKPVVTNEANKEKIEATLSHCLVEPDAHTTFSTAFTKVGYEFSEPPLALSYDEVSDSIKVWQGMNIGFYIKDAILRFNVLANKELPIVQNAHQIVNDYKESLVQIGMQANELDDRIRSIQTSKGNQSTSTVNERIPLRIKLDELNARLAEEPSLERFSELQAKLTLVENILSGAEKPERFGPDQILETDPEWLAPIADAESVNIGVLIEEKVTPAIQVPADKLKSVFPKLTAFHLTELEKSLDGLLKLSSLIIFLPENKLIPYRLELSGLNRRLNKLMKQELPQWLSYNRCLATTRAEALAAPE